MLEIWATDLNISFARANRLFSLFIKLPLTTNQNVLKQGQSQIVWHTGRLHIMPQTQLLLGEDQGQSFGYLSFIRVLSLLKNKKICEDKPNATSTS